MKTTARSTALATLVVVAAILLSHDRPTRDSEPFDAAKWVAATRSYAADLQSRGLPVPTSVSLRELVARGWLSHSDLGVLSDVEVTINPRPDETRPHEVLARATLPDGHQVVSLGDGSVQLR